MSQWVWLALEGMKTLGDRHRSSTGCGLKLFLALFSIYKNQNNYLDFPWQEFGIIMEPHDPLLPVP